MKKMIYCVWILATAVGGMGLQNAFAQTAGEKAVVSSTEKPVADNQAQSDSKDAIVTSSGSAVKSKEDTMQRITLWVMIQEGGVILWILMALSTITVMLTLYLFLTVTLRREIPPDFVRRAMSLLRAHDLRGAFQLCEGRDEIVANVLRAGLKVSGHDRYVIQDAMESEGERGASILWQKISYLNNIAAIAPLLGLLGTVWGMIGAFSAMAVEDAGARSLMMAYNVSKAMITTAAGLALAIPALVAYFYLRGRVMKIIAQLEAQASEMVELVVRSQGS